MSTPQEDPGSGPNRVRLIPRDQNTLAELMLRVTKNWADYPQYTLTWVTRAEATDWGARFAEAVETREGLSAGRQSRTPRLRTLQAEMDRSVTHVKNYVRETWSDPDEAAGHYAEFGLVREGDNDRLPSAQGARITALKRLIAALTTHGLADRKYGVAYWQPLLTEYQKLVGDSQADAQGISGVVGEKDPLEENVRLFLTKFDALLYANCRTEEQYLALRRQLGYLKEYN